MSVGITFESERKGLLFFSIFAVMGKLPLGDPCLRRDDRVREMVWGVTQHTGCRLYSAIALICYSSRTLGVRLILLFYFQR